MPPAARICELPGAAIAEAKDLPAASLMPRRQGASGFPSIPIRRACTASGHQGRRLASLPGSCGPRVEELLNRGQGNDFVPKMGRAEELAPLHQAIDGCFSDAQNLRGFLRRKGEPWQAAPRATCFCFWRFDCTHSASIRPNSPLSHRVYSAAFIATDSRAEIDLQAS